MHGVADRLRAAAVGEEAAGERRSRTASGFVDVDVRAARHRASAERRARGRGLAHQDAVVREVVAAERGDGERALGAARRVPHREVVADRRPVARAGRCPTRGRTCRRSRGAGSRAPPRTRRGRSGRRRGRRAWAAPCSTNESVERGARPLARLGEARARARPGGRATRAARPRARRTAPASRSNGTGLLGFDVHEHVEAARRVARELAELAGEHRADHRHVHEDEHDEREHAERHRGAEPARERIREAEPHVQRPLARSARPRGRSPPAAATTSTTAAPTSIRPCATNRNTPTLLCSASATGTATTPHDEHDDRERRRDRSRAGSCARASGRCPTNTNTGPISSADERRRRSTPSAGQRRARPPRAPSPA